MAAQFDTIHSPPNGGVKAAGGKYSEWFETSKEGVSPIPRAKPPSREKASWQHNISRTRKSDLNGTRTDSMLDNPYAAKPVMIRNRNPSPRSRRIKAAAQSSDTLSMTSIHSEPSAGYHDLTKVNFSPHLSRKHLKIKPHNSVENLSAATQASRVRPPAFEIVPNSNNSQARPVRRMRSQSQDPDGRVRLTPARSPKGPRRLESLDPAHRPSKHLSVSFGLLDFEQNKVSSILTDNKPKSNNLKGATTDWSLTKSDNMLHDPSSMAPRSNASSGLNVKDPRFLDPIPPQLQRSHTFDFGERKSRKEPPSWQTKTTTSANSRVENLQGKPPSGENRSRGKPSPKLGRRNQQLGAQSRDPREARDSRDVEKGRQQNNNNEPMKKAITPNMYRNTQYMYKMDKIASEAALEPQPKSNRTMDTKSDPIAKFAAQFASNMQSSGSRMSETSSLKDFELGQEMYTIAERSLENSRPTSEAGSTNSLEFLTSASMMNGAMTYPIHGHDILAMHDFPGRDQAPRKSILKKNSLHSTIGVYDFNRSVNLSASVNQTEEMASNKLADDQSSVHSITTFTTDKKKVTWDF